jgi:hypothetical protein
VDNAFQNVHSRWARLGSVYCTCKMWAHCTSRLHYVAFVKRIRIHRDSTYCTHMGAQTAHIWMQSRQCTHTVCTE